MRPIVFLPSLMILAAPAYAFAAPYGAGTYNTGVHGAGTAPTPDGTPRPGVTPLATTSATPGPSVTPGPVPSAKPVVSSAPAGTCPSCDVNGDTVVDVRDLSALLSNWRRSGRGDVNQDGKVDVFDLSLLLANWTGR